MILDFAHFENFIERRYPELHYKCNGMTVTDWDGEFSRDIDDILETLIPEIKMMCDQIRNFYYDNNEIDVLVHGYKIIWIKIMEWLCYNPDRIEWMLL